MIYIRPATILGVLFCMAPILFGARLIPPDVTVGQNLETPITVKLDEPAKQQLELTVTTTNPDLLLFSIAPDLVGARAVIVRVAGGSRESVAFYVHGVAKSGAAAYTVSASGYETGTGTATLAPSGFVIITSATMRSGGGAFSSPVGSRTRVTIHSAILDASLNYVAQQAIAGGVTASVEVSTSDPEVGSIVQSPVVMTGGMASARTEFESRAVGNTTLVVNVPKGFSAPAKYSKLLAAVTLPGLAIPEEYAVGKDLQSCVKFSLGQVVRPSGLALTLTSDNPKLLLSATDDAPGASSITLNLPPGSSGARYCMQALVDSGVATVTASAPRYRSNTSRVTLTPSGVLMGTYGPPDEAELFRKESAEREHGIVVPLASGPIEFSFYTSQLDPVTLRGADITLEPLRPGVSAKLELKNSNPAVGTIASSVIITDESADVQFTPLSKGKTVVSFSAPEGFTTPGNVTAFTVIVK